MLLSEFETRYHELCIFPGGFHPWSAGHTAVYNYLKNKFPKADLYVASSNKMSERPFSFAEKRFLAAQAGVPEDKFVEVVSPYKSTEITGKYDSANTVLIFGLSSKDRDRLGSPIKKNGELSYMQPYPVSSTTPLQTFDKHAYYVVVPAIQYKILGQNISSASKIREMYANGSETDRYQIIQELYPKSTKVNKIKVILDRVLLSPPKLDEHIVKLKNGKYRLLSHKGKNLGTFDSHRADAKHEGEVEYFKSLKESMTPNQEDRIVRFIKTNCTDILQIYKDHDFLYRGIHSVEPILFGKEVKNRMPVDSNEKASELLDSALSKVGFTALRSNSIFCTSDKLIASNYSNDHDKTNHGKVYVIFPLNGFSYTWCRRALDLTGKFGLHYVLFNEDNTYSDNSFVNDSINMPAREFTQTYGFTNLFLTDALNKMFEVYIHGKYIAVALNNKTLLDKIIKIGMNEVINSNDTPGLEISEAQLTCLRCDGKGFTLINGKKKKCVYCHGKKTINVPTDYRQRAANDFNESVNKNERIAKNDY
jgi:hypothetical protein